MPQDLHITIQKVAAGDPESFRDLFASFSSKIYLFALKLTRSKEIAEEVVQDVFLKIWDDRVNLKQIEHFERYLHVVTRNHCFNILKRMAAEARVKVAIGKELCETHTDTEESIILHDYQHLLHRVVEQLPPQQRTVYGLCHGEGLKYEEAAERLHISKLTVKTHMQHALRAIRANLGSLLAVYTFLFLPGF